MRLEDREMENKDFYILTDEDVVLLAQQGSKAAYEFLIDKYKGFAKIKSKKYYITGADNEDVVQEGMIGIFKAIRDYDHESTATFKTFLELCVTRQIVTAINKANRQKHQILNESMSLTTGETFSEEGQNGVNENILPFDEETNPENIFMIKEVVNHIKENGEDIFSPFETLVWNEILKGKNYREIAQSLNKTEKACDNAIQRIKKKIYEILK